jgi:hypothetical protein
MSTKFNQNLKYDEGQKEKRACRVIRFATIDLYQEIHGEENLVWKITINETSSSSAVWTLKHNLWVVNECKCGQ